jgi:hypothetical protein
LTVAAGFLVLATGLALGTATRVDSSTGFVASEVYEAGSRKPPAGRDRVRAELERIFEEGALVSSAELPD